MENHDFGGPLAGAITKLPLIRADMYLRMQATNLSVVDMFIRGLEEQLLAEYLAIERTPTESAFFVSSLSQLWFFGVYELFRTWRQRAKEIAEFAREILDCDEGDREACIARRRELVESGSSLLESGLSRRWNGYDAVIEDPAESIAQLSGALDRVEILYRRLEALRVHLAKHEVPKQIGSEAMAPGYGRIDGATGSMAYQVLLGGDEIDIVSRRGLADDIERLHDETGDVFLPESVRSELHDIPKISYAAKKVQVTLRDGSCHSRVHVAWNRQIVFVAGQTTIPFAASDVVKIEPCTAPEIDVDDDSEF